MVSNPGVIQMLVPNQYIWPNIRNLRRFLVLHKTAGFETAQEVAAYFQAGAPQADGTLAETSAHYVVGLDGTVVQVVREVDAAGANCCLEAGHDPFWPTDINLNFITFSIESVDPAQDNSTPMPLVQQRALFLLVYDLCTKWNIPMRPADVSGGIAGHASIAPLTRARCPGNFPWDALWAYLKGVSRMTELCAVTDTSQFAAGRSTDKCGFYAVSLLKYAGKAGASPTGSAAQVAVWADAEYVKYDGQDTSNNGSGMTVPMLYKVIGDAGLHYEGIGATETKLHTDHLTADYVRAWLRMGYPVVLAVQEDNVFDIDLGTRPYLWDTTGLSHVIVATGVAPDGNLLCHDTASIDANGVRRGPRRYNASALQKGMLSATAVVLPWLKQPTPDYDPIEEENMFHCLTIAEQKDYFVQTKAGKDDSWTCISNKVVLGGAHLNYFRWNGGVETHGLPTSVEVKITAAHPECTAVQYERVVNFYDPNGVIDRPADMNPNQPEKRVYHAKVASGFALQLIAGAQLAALQSEITTLEAQLKAAQTSGTGTPNAAQAAKLAQVSALAGQIAALLKA
jgi:N-acetyl-anhydromuramyl-L-alanine amidase AmpD